MNGKISSTLSCSGPAVGVVAGSKLPSYCIMSKTLAVAKRVQSLGEGMRIHISEVRNSDLGTFINQFSPGQQAFAG